MMKAGKNGKQIRRQVQKTGNASFPISRKEDFLELQTDLTIG